MKFSTHLISMYTLSRVKVYTSLVSISVFVSGLHSSKIKLNING